ncbi:hypothetical protein QBC42DRAFT_223603 [Cladorrhinum samala]|uniref:C2H2-type domain-containing protein n=1 Tax=Cladorrhinum samala TaxID=585594 RepID=A0AAV9HQQ3_9PEZI|nr:hypothetical protein QBC42DRAFT_223603 [Cladorrhinum samala]
MPSIETLDHIVVKPKRFQCGRCQRSFARLEHLQRHERTHTQERPFSCNLCESKFTRSDLLTRHERLSHSRAGGEPQPGAPGSAAATQQSSLSRKKSRKPRPSTSSQGSNSLPAGQVSQLGLSSSPPTVPFSNHSPETSSSGFVIAALDSNEQDGGDGGEFPSLVGSEEPLDDLCTFLGTEPLPSFHFTPTSISEQTNSPVFSFEPLAVASNSPYPFELIINESGLMPTESENISLDESGSLHEFCARLPLAPELSANNIQAQRVGISELPTLDRQTLLENIQLEFSAAVGTEFRLPTKLSLIRYIRAYTEGFHEHLPFLHLPTMDFEACATELVLAMAAVGAQYCFEPAKGLELFHAARAIANERIRRRDLNPSGQDLIQTAQALLILMAMATWSKHKEILREALAIQSILASIIRDDGLRTTQSSDHTSEDWRAWAQWESRLRTKFIVFCFFNLHCIVYDIPPLILNSELHMSLPCSVGEFRAETEPEWKHIKTGTPQPSSFQDAMRRIFSQEFESEPHSSLGNYILIHAIIQQIFLTRQTARCSVGSELTAQETKPLENALRHWQLCWERSPESSLDPSDRNGPVAFNSTALLRLAYIRLNIDTGPGRALGTRDPSRIAQALRDAPKVRRSPKLTVALLHSVQALSIPIQIGIRLVAKTQTFVWSIQHSLCSLECALLLSMWLETVSASASETCSAPQLLTTDEMRVLTLVKTMLDETEFGVSGNIWLDTTEMARKLNLGVLRAWATIFRGSQTWAIVDVIGSSLDLYAEMFI